jgi:hypothetical protein
MLVQTQKVQIRLRNIDFDVHLVTFFIDYCSNGFRVVVD